MFAVAGESLVDLVVQPDGRYAAVPGGAPFNFACALALQGVPAAYLNPLSDDPFGALLRDTLIRSGVHAPGPQVKAPTSLAVVTTDAQGRPGYGFYRSGVADRAIAPETLVDLLPDDARGVHTGGLALVPPDDAGLRELLRTAGARGLVRTLDVNARPAVTASLGIAPEAYRRAVLDTAALADVVKVSDEDLLHLGFAGDPLVAAASFLERGATLVVLTLGDQGAVALTRRGMIRQRAPCVPVVDAVGAGDCFFAGLVACLLRKEGMPGVLSGDGPGALGPALRHATACAAISLQRRGCQPATWDEASALAGTLAELDG